MSAADPSTGSMDNSAVSESTDEQPHLERFPELTEEDVTDRVRTDTQTQQIPEDINGENSLPSDTPLVDPKLIEALSEGFLARVMPDLQTSKAMLEELMRNQRVLIDTVQQENSKFDECQAFQELEETMKQAKLYHSKLINIKKDMNSLHEKSARLKKRAVKLQQQKQKEELQRAHQRDKEAERERMLVAKPAARKQATPPANINTPATPNPSYAKT